MVRRLASASIAGIVGVAALTLVSTPALAISVIDLTFEGINSSYPSTNYAEVQDFYNGGTSNQGTSGPNLGISFPDNALAICLNTPGNFCSNTSRGGVGDPDSQKGALFFLTGSNTFLDFADGFTDGFSFNYSAIGVGGTVNVFSGLDGTGDILATLTLPTTSSSCGSEFAAGFCPFFPFGVTFTGIAKSIGFGGVANQIVFDDVTFGSAIPGGPGGGTTVPEPTSLLLLVSGLLGLAFIRRRSQIRN